MLKKIIKEKQYKWSFNKVNVISIKKVLAVVFKIY